MSSKTHDKIVPGKGEPERDRENAHTCECTATNTINSGQKNKAILHPVHNSNSAGNFFFNCKHQQKNHLAHKHVVKWFRIMSGAVCCSFQFYLGIVLKLGWLTAPISQLCGYFFDSIKGKSVITESQVKQI